MDQTKRIQDLEEQISTISKNLSDLSGVVYKNNFGATQTFNKDSVFTARMRPPVYSSAPAVGEIGDLIVVSGKLYVCTTASTGGSGAVFTLVGSQT